MKPGETVRIGFSVYNGNTYDITVKVTVYQKEPSLKEIGQTSFKADAKSFTRFTSLLEFTMPNTNKAVLHAEADIIYPDGTKNHYGANWTVYRKEEPPTEPPKDPEPPTTDLKQLAIEAVKQKYGSDTSVKQVNQYSNYYVMDVTKYMKRTTGYTDITAAWLLIKLDPISINAISSPYDVPTYNPNTWVEGKKYEVININGGWYAVTLPANFLIYWNTNKYKYYKATTDICSAVKYLGLAGYSVTISECSGSTGSGDSDSGDTGDTSTAPSEPKDDKKSYLLLAGGGAAILFLVLLLRRR